MEIFDQWSVQDNASVMSSTKRTVFLFENESFPNFTNQMSNSTKFLTPIVSPPSKSVNAKLESIHNIVDIKRD